MYINLYLIAWTIYVLFAYRLEFSYGNNLTKELYGQTNDAKLMWFPVN